MRVRCCLRVMKTEAWVPAAAPRRQALALAMSPQKMPRESRAPLQHRVVLDHQLQSRWTSMVYLSGSSRFPAFPSVHILNCTQALTAMFITSKLNAAEAQPAEQVANCGVTVCVIDALPVSLRASLHTK